MNLILKFEFSISHYNDVLNTILRYLLDGWLTGQQCKKRMFGVAA
jgi:hypothetical protein